MASPFDSLREIVMGMQSTDDASEKMIDFVDSASSINNLYLSISIQKEESTQKLLDSIETGKQNQQMAQRSLYKCQTLADQIIQKDIALIDVDDMNLLPFDEFLKQSELDPDVASTLNQEALLKLRLQHEEKRAEVVSARFSEVSQEYTELGKRLNETKQRYTRLVHDMRGFIDMCQTFVTNV